MQGFRACNPHIVQGSTVQGLYCVQKKLLLCTWSREMWSFSHRTYTLLVERVPIQLNDSGWWTCNTHPHTHILIDIHWDAKYDYNIFILLYYIINPINNCIIKQFGGYYQCVLIIYFLTISVKNPVFHGIDDLIGSTVVYSVQLT